MAARWSLADDAAALRMDEEGKTHAAIGARLGRTTYAVNTRISILKRAAKMASATVPRRRARRNASAAPAPLSALDAFLRKPLA